MGWSFMNTRLVLIEGLPGSGKSTVAQFVSQILFEQGAETQLFLEGNVDHPADFEGVAFYQQDEFDQLLLKHEAYSDMITTKSAKHSSGYLISYRKIKDEWGSQFPDELIHEIGKKDIYELPFDQHVKLLVDRWNTYVEDHLQGSAVSIFECCFIQNPLTIGTVKYNVQKEEVTEYVSELERIIKPLNPLLIYVDQQDVRFAFEKAIDDRPREWSEGFIEYYTTQGYGKMRGCESVDGTVQVLEERKSIELEIFNRLKIDKHKIDNSAFDMEKCKYELRKILS